MAFLAATSRRILKTVSNTNIPISPPDTALVLLDLLEGHAEMVRQIGLGHDEQAAARTRMQLREAIR